VFIRGNLFSFLHQIGKQNKNGLLVKKEKDTIEEIYENMGMRAEFHPYNTIEQENDREK